ncbi:hypothetical protein [Thalassotalea sp. G2M2-11]|uniref:DUF6957 family protein n=1 Tax=Thalassotalea sp. G2M2-11 TaxID=2787627 RepID=UPI0019CFFFCF|nr:hypothetical protein [Thalassotalea sp. G2M2-11]
MNTVVKDWQIVSVYEAEEHIGDVLYATVVDDSTIRFCKGDYVTTSKIKKINFETQLITTTSGSIYQLLGTGSKAKIDLSDFELLRHGFSPQQINGFNNQNLILH